MSIYLKFPFVFFTSWCEKSKTEKRYAALGGRPTQQHCHVLCSLSTARHGIVRKEIICGHVLRAGYTYNVIVGKRLLDVNDTLLVFHAAQVLVHSHVDLSMRRQTHKEAANGVH